MKNGTSDFYLGLSNRAGLCRLITENLVLYKACQPRLETELFFKIEVQFSYNIILVSGVQHANLVLHLKLL